MYQKLTLIGNLGRDPEMRFTTSGQPVANFSLATSEKWTGQDGAPQERTLWWRISVYGKLAETCHTWLHKGSKVYLEGRVTGDAKTGGPRTFTRADGSTGVNFEVTAAVVKFLSPRAEADDGAPAGAPEAESGETPAADEGEEPPF